MYLPGGEVPKPGILFTNRRHAETYRRILKEAEAGGGGREAEIERARRAWSHGFVAEAVDGFCRGNEVMDVSGRRHRGVLTAQDMATWAPTVEEPVHLDYGSWRVLKPNAWTQGPVLLQMLALLKGFDLDRLSPTDPDFIHIWTECAKLAYADREAFYGDPGHVEVPMETLLSEAYNAERRKLVGDTASLEQRPGTVAGYGGRVIVKDARAMGAGAGEPTFARISTGHGADEVVGARGEVRGDTVHIDVIDKAGNMFTATPSGGWLQSSPVIPELGWPLGSRGQMFWLEEGLPGSLAPGKRPRSTLSVGMALRDGQPYMSWGTPGGDQQDQWNSQFFLRHASRTGSTPKMNLQEAIDAPAWHIEHFPLSFWPRTARPGVLVVEGRLPAATIEGAGAPRPQGRGRTPTGRRAASPPCRRTAPAARPPPTPAACRATPPGDREVSDPAGLTPCPRTCVGSSLRSTQHTDYSLSVNASRIVAVSVSPARRSPSMYSARLIAGLRSRSRSAANAAMAASGLPGGDRG